MSRILESANRATTKKKKIQEHTEPAAELDVKLTSETSSAPAPLNMIAAPPPESAEACNVITACATILVTERSFVQSRKDIGAVREYYVYLKVDK